MIRSSGFRKYFANTSWLFLDRVIRLGLTLLVGIAVTRHLGAELFGQLNYSAAIVGIFFVLAYLGLNEIVVRDLVRHPERRDELLGTSMGLKFMGSMLLVVTVMAFVLLKDMNRLTVHMVLVISLAELFKPSIALEYFYMSRVEGRKVALINIVQSLTSSGFKIVLIFLDAPLIWFAGSYMVDILVYGLALLWVYERDGYSLKALRYSGRMAMYLLGQAWPLIIYGIALNIQLKIDQIMIFDILSRIDGEAAANIEVGQYSVAVKMIEAVSFLPVIIQMSLAPAIARAKVEDSGLYEQRLLNQYRLMFLLYLTTSIPLYFVAEPIIVLLYGEDFRLAGHILAIFAMRLVFSYIGVAKNSFITNEGLFKFTLFTAIVGALVNIGFNAWLIPTMRSSGAVWATLISFFVSVFLLDLLFKRTRVNFKLMALGMLTFWRIRGAS
jgi:O-antigen/teichoic acid export membrane protein